MKLTKFQQYIKDKNIKADKGETMAKSFMQDIKNDFNDEYQELRGDVENSLDLSEIVENSIFYNTDTIRQRIAAQIKLRVNKLIAKTLEKIESIEEDNKTEVEPEDCTDADKRYWELHRDD